MIYNQRDSTWSKEQLGFGSTTLGTHGCVVTAVSQILFLNGYNETPSTVNQKLKAVNGYAGTNRNLIIWEKLKEAYPNIITGTERLYYYANTRAVEAIKANKGVLVRVDGTRIGASEHWVTYVGGGKLNDPWNGVIRDTSYYPANGMTVITVKPKQGGGDNSSMNLKQRLSDKDWGTLTEFEELRKKGLIDRADSIQTQTQKWLKSDASLSAEVSILIRAKKTAENEAKELKKQLGEAVEQAKKLEEKHSEETASLMDLIEEQREYTKVLERKRDELEEKIVGLERSKESYKIELEAYKTQEFTIPQAIEILISSFKRGWQTKPQSMKQ